MQYRNYTDPNWPLEKVRIFHIFSVFKLKKRQLGAYCFILLSFQFTFMYCDTWHYPLLAVADTYDDAVVGCRRAEKEANLDTGTESPKKCHSMQPERFNLDYSESKGEMVVKKKETHNIQGPSTQCYAESNYILWWRKWNAIIEIKCQHFEEC